MSLENGARSAGIGVDRKIMRYPGILVIEVDRYLRSGRHGDRIFIKRYVLGGQIDRDTARVSCRRG